MAFITRLGIHTVMAIGIFYVLDHYVFIQSFEITGRSDILAYGIVALVFGFLNTFIKPLLKIVTFPFYLLTLGFLGFILNGVMLWLLVQVVDRLSIFDTAVFVDGWLMYLVIGFILSFFNTIIHW